MILGINDMAEAVLFQSKFALSQGPEFCKSAILC
jgi:hypothetical protein